MPIDDAAFRKAQRNYDNQAEPAWWEEDDIPGDETDSSDFDFDPEEL